VAQIAEGGYLCDVARRLGQSCALLEALNPQLAAGQQAKAQEAARQPTTSITTSSGARLYVRPGASIRAGPCSAVGQLQQGLARARGGATAAVGGR
jgi:hypothetical protein